MIWTAILLAALFNIFQCALDCKGIELKITDPQTEISTRAYPVDVCLSYVPWRVIVGQSFRIKCVGNDPELTLYSTSNDCTGASSVTTFADILTNFTLTTTSYCDQSISCPLLTARLYDGDDVDCSGVSETHYGVMDYCTLDSDDVDHVQSTLSTCNGTHYIPQTFLNSDCSGIPAISGSYRSESCLNGAVTLIYECP
eukprot:895596_1